MHDTVSSHQSDSIGRNADRGCDAVEHSLGWALTPNEAFQVVEETAAHHTVRTRREPRKSTDLNLLRDIDEYVECDDVPITMLILGVKAYEAGAVALA